MILENFNLDTQYKNPQINCNNLKIFLCAHKPIKNYIPKDERYIIIAQTKDVDNSYNDNFHDIIDISDDEFTKNHNICWGEGCAMRYLYNHPELIPEYICFGHYRRIFLDFVGKEDYIPQYIKKYGAIIKKPFKHKKNLEAIYKDHPKEEAKVFLQSIIETIPNYWKSFQKLAEDKNQYACNIFAMKKEDFLEMCEICFKVLDHLDKKQGYTNNEDVFNKMVKISHREHLKHGILWQRRLQGFWLEWLTDLYYRYKFGVENCYISEAGIPDFGPIFTLNY